MCYSVKGERRGGRTETGIVDDTSFRAAGGGLCFGCGISRATSPPGARGEGVMKETMQEIEQLLEWDSFFETKVAKSANDPTAKNGA
jgi:hypothetical protein